MNHLHKVMSASTLIGDDVKNHSGQDLGKIEEIVLDTEQNRIAYAVLSFGGILGVGDKLFAIPWQALNLDTDEKCFYLDVNKEKLESAPGFDKNNWPDMANNDWGMRVHDYYSVKPYWN